jgi:hypothetical protein
MNATISRETPIGGCLERLVGAIDREMGRLSKLSARAMRDAPQEARYKINTAWVNLDVAREIITTEMRANDEDEP